MFKCELCGEIYAYEDEVMLLDCNGISLSLDEINFIEYNTICLECVSKGEEERYE